MGENKMGSHILLFFQVGPVSRHITGKLSPILFEMAEQSEHILNIAKIHNTPVLPKLGGVTFLLVSMI